MTQVKQIPLGQVGENLAGIITSNMSKLMDGEKVSETYMKGPDVQVRVCLRNSGNGITVTKQYKSYHGIPSNDKHFLVLLSPS